MRFDELVTAAAQRLGIDEIAPQENHEYWLFSDDGARAVIYQNRDGENLLRAEVGKLPDDGAEAERVLKQLLRWNFGRVKHQHASLSLAPDDGNLWLHQRLGADSQLSVERLLADLEHFLNCLEFWRKRLTATAEQPHSPLPFLFR